MNVDPASHDWLRDEADGPRVPEEQADSEQSFANQREENLPVWLEKQTNNTQPIICRRCGKTIAGDLVKCPFCEARVGPVVLETTSGVARLPFTPIAATDESESVVAITRLLIFYIALLATNLVGHWIGEAISEQNLSKQEQINTAMVLTVLIEVVDTIIVLIAIAKIPKPPRIGPTSVLQRSIGAATAPLLFVIALGMNFGYHKLLSDYVQYPLWTQNDFRFPIGWGIVLICIQPAIVEELLCRYLALGTLTRVMGIGAAIGVSSLMFGLAHSGVLLSIPILTVMGACLGLVRVWSGSMVLPMLLHALNNAAALYMEWRK